MVSSHSLFLSTSSRAASPEEMGVRVPRKELAKNTIGGAASCIAAVRCFIGRREKCTGMIGWLVRTGSALRHVKSVVVLRPTQDCHQCRCTPATVSISRTQRISDDETAREVSLETLGSKAVSNVNGDGKQQRNKLPRECCLYFRDSEARHREGAGLSSGGCPCHLLVLLVRRLKARHLWQQ